MFKAAAIQMGATEHPDENVGRAEKYIRIAADRGAKLVALPELFHTPWFPAEVSDKAFAYAETSSGPVITSMKRLSKELGIVIVAPFFEKRGSKYYNSAAVIDAGKLRGIYRKVHLPNLPYWEETHYFSRGSGFPVFQTSVGPIGLQLCYDTFFFEGFRTLALKGARIVVTPTASAYATQPRWKAALVTHAHLNTVYVLRVNRTGKERHQEFYGGSFIAGPDGVIAGREAGRHEGVFISNIDPDDIDAVRSLYPYLELRRPRLYRTVSGGEG